MKSKFFNNLIKGILAGLCIGIGGTAYLLNPNSIGAFLFSIGLISICMFGFNLYTGKIGFLVTEKSKKDFTLKTLIPAYIGNIIGACGTGYLIKFTKMSKYVDIANQISTTKINTDLLSMFILSMFCGVIIYLIVNYFVRYDSHPVSKFAVIVMGIMTFILCGFEHCIANTFYFSVANAWSLKAILSILIVTLGNTVGSLLTAFAEKVVKDGDN